MRKYSKVTSQAICFLQAVLNVTFIWQSRHPCSVKTPKFLVLMVLGNYLEIPPLPDENPFSLMNSHQRWVSYSVPCSTSLDYRFSLGGFPTFISKQVPAATGSILCLPVLQVADVCQQMCAEQTSQCHSWGSWDLHRPKQYQMGTLVQKGLELSKTEWKKNGGTLFLHQEMIKKNKNKKNYV